VPAISRITFTEENDARPTYVCAIAAGLALIIDRVILDNAANHTRTLYIIAIWIFLIAAISGITCLMGCIWHPIPKERRADGQLTKLHLNESPDITSTLSTPMFSSLEERITSDDEESVGDSQIELRDPIQWIKMTLVLACIGIDILLLIKWNH
jgi:hypothetical protein